MSNESRQKHPIAIVGMACMFPKSPDLKGFWQVIHLGQDTISEVPDTHWSPDDYFDENQKAPDRTYCRRGGFIEPYGFDPTEFSLPPTVLEATDTSQLLGLVVAKAALEDAGYGPDRTFTRDKTSVILGVTGCLELVIPLGARLGHPYWRRALQESGLDEKTTEEVMQRIAQDYVPWQENSFPGLLGNVVAGRIANRLDLHGSNCVVDAACASTLSAAHLAALELECGRADMVVTGGTDTFNDIFMYMCFSKTPALSASGKIRPFDGSSDGTLLGEGIGMVVMKRLEDAERDGDRVYAVIKGVGSSSDGSQKAVYAPYSPGQARALRRAYEISDVCASTIDLVEAHGTGTKVGDVVEFEALKTVYSELGVERQSVALGSVKSQIGHTKAAAGAAGLIKAALALHHKVLPPTINIEEPNPKMGIEESPFYLNTLARPWLKPEKHPRRAALSSFGFGGSNYHTVLEEHGSERTEPAWDGSVQILAFSGASREALLQKMKGVSRPFSPEQLGWNSRREFNSKDGFRCLVVDESAKIEKALDKAIEKLEAGKEPDFYGEGQAPGPVAFMFPGQGSQYVNMCRELACVFPEFLEALQGTGADIARYIYPVPAFGKAALKEQEAELKSTDRAQPALGAINSAMAAVLGRFGIEPEYTAGHSFGELCALHAAGVYDSEALYTLSRLRGELMNNQGEDLGTMLAVTGPVEKVEEILKKSKLEVKLANRNSPTQVVLSGSREAVAEAAPIMKEAGLNAIPLQVGAAFHSPLVAGARDPFRKGMEKLKFKKPGLPVYANKTAKTYPSTLKKAKDILADQLVHEVNFVGQVEKMYDDGARVFIEVGPKKVLTRLIGAILGDKAHVALALDASQGKRRALVDLAKGLAGMAAMGLPVQLGAWEEEPKPVRKKRMEIPICGANYRPDFKRMPPSQRKLVEPKASTPAAAPPAQPVSQPKAQAPRPTPAAPVAPAAVDPSVQEALQNVQASITAMQTMAQQTAQAHQAFLAGQQQAQQALTHLLARSQNLAPGAPRVQMPAPTPPTPISSPIARPAPVPAPMPAARPAPMAVAKPAPQPVAKPVPQPAVRAASLAPKAPAGLEKTVLATVADKTGYPVEMLNLEMDLEADLGIDSIKRVEILAAVEEAVPGLPKVEPDRMGSLRTLAQVVEALGVSAGATPAAPPKPSGALSQSLLEVVAEKTGYPVEMLNLEMDLEADLGIDSIKRVEILAAVEEAVPGLPKVEADQMGTLRTLGQIVEAFGSVAAPAPASSGMAPPASTGVAQKLLQVVAEKTGYPTEMLNLEMDLEADLGIDSIKRVEILAAVEEAIPGLPKVEADQMGAMRTLGQIVEALGSPAAASTAPVLAPSSGVAEKLLQVVAEKTGYPTEMLNLEMDLEADLGIDSIKRVEILAAVEEAIPGLPKVEADQMGAMRTLGQIVEALGSSAAPAAATPAPVMAPSSDVAEKLLQVVADKTGYPTDMLNLEMDLEADLGIDSIKRVEILAAVEEAIPGLPKVEADQMGAMRTLGQIVEALGSSAAPAPAPAKAPTSGVAEKLLQVVAAKTGYPTDMLSLEMDLEADLGIDSIKRVEILAAMEEAIPGLPKVEADQMGAMRTLGQIVESLGNSSSAVAVASPARPAPAPSSKASASTEVGRRVVRLSDLGAGNPRKFPVAAGKKVSIAEDIEGIGAELATLLKSRGLEVELLKKGNLPQDLGCLVLVANGAEASTSTEFLKQAFRWAREAAPRLRASRGSIFTVTRMDGAFGLTGKNFDPVSGGLAGIPKTVAHEWPEVTTRALDVAPEVEADLIADEFCTDGPLEVGLNAGGRQGLSIAELPCSEGTPYLAKGDLMVVTGGARGVTAATAVAIARAYKTSMLLLGRSPEPSAEPKYLKGLTDEAAIKKALLADEFGGKAKPAELEKSFRSHMANREIRETLAALEAAGAKAVYRSVDVRDLKALKKTLKAVSKDLGPVRAVMHGAGVLADRRIEEKTDEQFERVFDTKIVGLQNLLACVDELKALVLFSSVTARFGRPGQVDYCMANEVLNKVAQLESRKRPKCKVVAMGWGPWDGGMVTPGLRREFQRLGVGLIPLEAGALALVKELAHRGKDQVETLIGDGFPEPEKPSGTRSEQQLLDSVFQKTISLGELPMLESHQIGGRPVLPMALMLEWFAHAALHRNVGLRFFGVENMRVLKGLVLDGELEPTITVSAGPAREFGDRVMVDVELRDLTRDILHARATVVLVHSLPPAPVAASINGLAQKSYPHPKEAIYQELLFHGPHFQGIEAVEGYSEEGLVAALASAPKPAKWISEPLRSEWLTDPLMVDGVLQLGILWCIEALEKPSLPNGGVRYLQYCRRFPKEGARAILKVVRHSNHKLVANVDLVDTDGRVLANYEGLEWTADANLRQAFVGGRQPEVAVK